MALKNDAETPVPIITIPIITIDGTSGTGKGTVAYYLAQHLKWHLLDSGALYRVLAYQSQIEHISLENEDKLTELVDKMCVEFKPSPNESEVMVYLQDKNITHQIRTQNCANIASKIAKYQGVRSALLKTQRSFCRKPGLVTDGRDMGTVVFPSATLKIFLNASLNERAIRRHKQLKEKGISVNVAEILEELTLRDKRDMERAISPLTPADDAHTVDTTQLTIEEVVNYILHLYQTIRI